MESITTHLVMSTYHELTQTEAEQTIDYEKFESLDAFKRRADEFAAEVEDDLRVLQAGHQDFSASSAEKPTKQVDSPTTMR